MERVLVTGGAGFIGSHVSAALLRAGFRARILDNLSPQIHGGVPRWLDWLAADGIEFQRDRLEAANAELSAREMLGAASVS